MAPELCRRCNLILTASELAGGVCGKCDPRVGNAAAASMPQEQRRQLLVSTAVGGWTLLGFAAGAALAVAVQIRNHGKIDFFDGTDFFLYGALPALLGMVLCGTLAYVLRGSIVVVKVGFWVWYAFCLLGLALSVFLAVRGRINC